MIHTTTSGFELLSHPVLASFNQEFNLTTFQGFQIQSSTHTLVQSIIGQKANISCCLLETGEYESMHHFSPKYFYPNQVWKDKLTAAQYLRIPLLFLSRGTKDHYLFRLHEVALNAAQEVIFVPKMIFPNETSFVTWWKKISTFEQNKTKASTEAQTTKSLFEHVLAKHNQTWGKGIDGFLFSESTKRIRAILEIRYTSNQSLDAFDPSHQFNTRRQQSAAFNSWLPYIYLQKVYEIPLVLITLNQHESAHFGWALIEGMNYNRLSYAQNIPPTQQVGGSFSEFSNWLNKLC